MTDMADMPTPDFKDLDNTEVTTYICENCGATAELTQQAAFNDGWDYPGIMFSWNVLQPHTCGDCGIDTTLWWQMIQNPPADGEQRPIEEFIATLDQRHQDTWARIQQEMKDHTS